MVAVGICVTPGGRVVWRLDNVCVAASVNADWVGCDCVAGVGDWYVDGSSYGDERRFALRPPAALVMVAVPLAWILTVAPLLAGILLAEAVDEFPAEKWRAVIDVNLVGYFLCAKHAARVMKAQRSGSILQINSKSGKKGSYKNSAYAASKFGGIGLTQSIALELAEYGVRANAICPGNLLDSPLWVDSLYSQYAKKWGITEEEVRQKYVDQVPMKRGCTYDDITNVVVFLASEQAGYMTGQAINVTGGQEMR